jgi:hypothetical protein
MNIPPELNGFPTTSVPGQLLQRGNLIAENNCWGAGDHPYEQQVFLRENGTPIAGWCWNALRPHGGVMAFPEIIYGQKPWLQIGCGKLPLPLASCYGLTVDYATRSQGTGEFNTAFECWLTDGEPSKESILDEVMFWVGNQGSKQPAGRRVLNESNFELWQAEPEGERQWKITTMVCREPVPAGVLDIGNNLRNLVGSAYIRDNLTLASVEFGNEVHSEAGWTVIDKYEVTLS